MAKRIKLEEMRSITGQPFRRAVERDDGTPLLEKRKDADGKDIMQVPRNSNGEPMPNCYPEPVYQIRTEVIGKGETLPEQLKTLFLRIPRDKLTRQDTIYGTKMFLSIDKIQNGYPELDDDVPKWLREKLQDKETEGKDGVITPGIGLSIFGVNRTIVEEALENYERPHEKKAVEVASE